MKVSSRLTLSPIQGDCNYELILQTKEVTPEKHSPLIYQKVFSSLPPLPFQEVYEADKCWQVISLHKFIIIHIFALCFK